ncbi:TPA: Bro-N domain-containing protein [Klebsiella aerogenes]|nr:Bro-N domain-containing protein [Klebsiella aerogenes]
MKNVASKSVAKPGADFTIFKFGESEIRVISKSGEPWFVAADICKALQIGNPTKAIKNLDDDEKALTLIQGLSRGNEEGNIVSESGMYTLVLRCRDAVNKGTIPHKFRKWVTAEVLPSIRNHGEYVKGSKTTVEERTPLRDAVNLLVGKKGLRYDDAYNMIHQRFSVDSIDELGLDQIPVAVEYVHRIALEGELLDKQEQSPVMPMIPISANGEVIFTFRDGYIVSATAVKPNEFLTSLEGHTEMLLRRGYVVCHHKKLRTAQIDFIGQMCDESARLEAEWTLANRNRR